MVCGTEQHMGPSQCRDIDHMQAAYGLIWSAQTFWPKRPVSKLCCSMLEYRFKKNQSQIIVEMVDEISQNSCWLEQGVEALQFAHHEMDKHY